MTSHSSDCLARPQRRRSRSSKVRFLLSLTIPSRRVLTRAWMNRSCVHAVCSGMKSAATCDKIKGCQWMALPQLSACYVKSKCTCQMMFVATAIHTIYYDREHLQIATSMRKQRTRRWRTLAIRLHTVFMGAISSDTFRKQILTFFAGCDCDHRLHAQLFKAELG